MNVVGKVGRVISRGVYSVATPFHPFGGAIDVIVVQQQDGTFRSTPWYVRFGKFQGVLKGSENMVRINVNGVEADFHMHLDSSGEAYFLREIEPGKGSEGNGDSKDSEDLRINGGVAQITRLEHSVSDSGVAQFLEERDPASADQLDRAESDVDRRYYDFEDEQFSIEESVELSDFGSDRYENLNGENASELSSSDSVLVVSVDGHVLTAPVSSADQDMENVQLSTPQFHLGPGEGPEFNSGVGDDAWAADYISRLNASESSVAAGKSCNVDNADTSFTHHLEVCEGDGEHVCQSQETEEVLQLQEDNTGQSDSDDMFNRIKKKDVFKSCLELSQFTEQNVNTDSEGIGPSLEVNKPESLRSSLAVDRIENWPASLHDIDSTGPVESPSSQVDCEAVNAFTGSEGLDSSMQRPGPENHDGSSENLDRLAEHSSGEVQACSSMGFEISLCAKELRAGMGSDTASKAFQAHLVSVDEFSNSAASIMKGENLIVRYGENYLTWEKAAPFVLGKVAFGLDLPIGPKDVIPVKREGTPERRETDAAIPSMPTGSSRWSLWPIPFRKVKTLDHTTSSMSSEELFVDTESGVQNLSVESASVSNDTTKSLRKQFVRTNVPTSEQIASLNLKDGQNMITFSFSTMVLGFQKVDAHIYLWKWNARIVISDVDGTITKSDVLGQFMPLVGRDWTQSGVAKLFSAIKENGYQLLFLSARAIVQAYLTRSFLLNLRQDGKTLPNGPVVISPDGLFPALYREVIRRAPHEFKIACLEDIRKLFPPDYNPFYAGFGNRDTDELSYRKIGIPRGKIFIINPKGEVASSHRTDVKSYTSLHTLVNDMFPPTMVEQEDYNSWNFWRVPLPEIDL